jgi:hypothetical protein
MIELPEAQEIAKEILLSNPDARFGPANCTYFDDEQKPRCVIGYVFARIGIPSSLMKPHFMGHTPNTSRLECLIRPTAPDFLSVHWNNRVSPAASELFVKIQDLQDTGASWGEVYEQFFGGSDEED